MKIQELFEEEKSFITKKQIRAMYEDCLPYFEEINFNFDFKLYRGVKRNALIASTQEIAQDVYTMILRKNRLPTDTPLNVHEITDDWMLKKFGERFRSNALFCTPEKLQSMNYGEPFIVLPIGSFSYLWSNKVKDLFHTFNKERIEKDGKEKSVNELGHFISDVGEDISKEIQNEIIKVLINQEYQTENLISNENNEVMLACEKFYIIHPSVYSQFISEEFKNIKRENKS